jgi:hypothetical protein
MQAVSETTNTWQHYLATSDDTQQKLSDATSNTTRHQPAEPKNTMGKKVYQGPRGRPEKYRIPGKSFTPRETFDNIQSAKAVNETTTTLQDYLATDDGTRKLSDERVHAK